MRPLTHQPQPEVSEGTHRGETGTALQQPEKKTIHMQKVSVYSHICKETCLKIATLALTSLLWR